MPSDYYKQCRELDECTKIWDEYSKDKDYKKVFERHLPLAEKGYSLAECQVGWLYYEGLGTEKDYDKALYWTRRGALHGDRDCQYNLYSMFYKKNIGDVTEVEALSNLQLAKVQNHKLAVNELKMVK